MNLFCLQFGQAAKIFIFRVMHLLLHLVLYRMHFYPCIHILNRVLTFDLQILSLILNNLHGLFVNLRLKIKKNYQFKVKDKIFIYLEFNRLVGLKIF